MTDPRHGRQYHAYKAGTYHLPNDANEQDRLDMQHHLYRIALDDQLFLAPMVDTNVRNVLDVGCGTGLWAIDVAESLPEAKVVGFDLRCVRGTIATIRVP